MNIFNLQSGDKITGLYYGTFFSGSLKSFRYNYPSASHRVELIIDLDKVIPVGNEFRSYVLLNCKNGKPEYKDCEIWSTLDSRGNFYMADRFEAIESDPQFAIKLYREMQEQSKDRSRALHARGIWWNSDDNGLLAKEIMYRFACDTLISHYTKLL